MTDPSAEHIAQLDKLAQGLKDLGQPSDTSAAVLTEVAKAFVATGRLAVTLGQRIDVLTAYVEQRFDRMDKRLDGMDKRLDGMDTKLNNIASQIGELDIRVGAVETRMTEVEQAVNRVARQSGVAGTLQIGTPIGP